MLAYSCSQFSWARIHTAHKSWQLRPAFSSGVVSYTQESYHIQRSPRFPAEFRHSDPVAQGANAATTCVAQFRRKERTSCADFSRRKGARLWDAPSRPTLPAVGERGRVRVRCALGELCWVHACPHSTTHVLSPNECHSPCPSCSKLHVVPFFPIHHHMRPCMHELITCQLASGCLAPACSRSRSAV